jgi:hypothetical protein
MGVGGATPRGQDQRLPKHQRGIVPGTRGQAPCTRRDAAVCVPERKLSR